MSEPPWFCQFISNIVGAVTLQAGGFHIKAPGHFIVNIFELKCS